MDLQESASYRCATRHLKRAQWQVHVRAILSRRSRSALVIEVDKEEELPVASLVVATMVEGLAVDPVESPAGRQAKAEVAEFLVVVAREEAAVVMVVPMGRVESVVA